MGVSVLRGQGVGLPTVKVSFWPGVRTHRMEIVNDIYKKLHDLDYFLLRYGPKDVAKYVEDDSTVSKYYGTLPFY